jgi:flavodoxin
MKSLVVYYSRTGTTKKVAEIIAQKIDADIEEIIDKKSRKGVLGFLSGGKDAVTKAATSIEEPKKNPDDYDIVVIGTPVWAGTMAPAIRTYLNIRKIKKSAFFYTSGSGKGSRVFADMLDLIVDTNLVDKFGIKTVDVKSGNYNRLDEFIEKIRK